MTKLRIKLMEKGWSMNELARQSGVERTIIYRYVKGTIKKPRDLTLDKFSKALGCDIEELMEK